MLGEVVELGFEVAADAPVKTADVIGFIEGFKAVSDLFCVVDGRFEGGNATLLKGKVGLAQVIQKLVGASGASAQTSL